MGSYLALVALFTMTSFYSTWAMTDIRTSSQPYSSSTSSIPQNSTRANNVTSTMTPHPPCPSNAQCKHLDGNCLKEIPGCNTTCDYGKLTDVYVQPVESVPCEGERNHSRTLTCVFCYQLPQEDYDCEFNTSCNSVGTYSSRVYRSRCTVKPTTLCFGKRHFYKNRLCHWTRGHSWSITLLLSVTLGGFGIDRFYLGYWKEGIGKLFSFGGLGVWTIVDVILISIGYVSPQDGSLYTYRVNLTAA